MKDEDYEMIDATDVLTKIVGSIATVKNNIRIEVQLGAYRHTTIANTIRRTETKSDVVKKFIRDSMDTRRENIFSKYPFQ